MCGRYSNDTTADLMAAFDVHESYIDELTPSYNVAPTDPVPLVLDRSSIEGEPVTRKLVTARWGLVPSWAKDPKGGARLINARMETVTEKPFFRQAASKRRGLLVGDGYYVASGRAWGDRAAAAVALSRRGMLLPASSPVSGCWASQVASRVFTFNMNAPTI